MKCLAGQRDIAAKIGTVPPDSGRLTGMSSILQVRSSLPLETLDKMN